MTKFSARKEPLRGWVPQFWIEHYKNWFDFPGWEKKGYWNNPQLAVMWAKKTHESY